MNALVMQNLTARAISDSTITGVPAMGEGLIERMLAHPDQVTFGTVTLIVLSFVFARIIQPACDRISTARAKRIDAETALIDAARAAHVQTLRDLDTMLDYTAILARGIERMADAVHAIDCSDGDKPLSDTTLGAVQEIAKQPRRRKPHHKPGDSTQ